MAHHRILLTGASGYIGGTILARLAEAKLPPHSQFFALTRTPAQSEAVKQYGVTPLQFDSYDQKAVTEAVLGHQITVVFFLHDPFTFNSQQYFIEALAKVKEQTGHDVHFLHTTGGKTFSSHAGTEGRHISDLDADLYETQKAQFETHSKMHAAVETNLAVIDIAQKHGVRSYIFAPCAVYGRGEGFGNKISIQTVAIVKAAKAVGKVYKVDTEHAVWPVSHVIDTASLYLQILRVILTNDPVPLSALGSGKSGYYLASSGLVVWDDIYSSFAQSLFARGIISDTSIELADDSTLDKMAEALECGRDEVAVQIGGRCGFVSEHGARIGWTSRFGREHVLENADEEVGLILEHI